MKDRRGVYTTARTKAGSTKREIDDGRIHDGAIERKEIDDERIHDEAGDPMKYSRPDGNESTVEDYAPNTRRLPSKESDGRLQQKKAEICCDGKLDITLTTMFWGMVTGAKWCNMM